MVAMLIQHIAGCPREYLVADYAASTDQLLAANFAEQRMSRGLPADEPGRSELIDQLSRCHPWVMEETLRFADQRWGGLDQYLDSIEFDSQRREAMRAAILEVKPPRDKS